MQTDTYCIYPCVLRFPGRNIFDMYLHGQCHARQLGGVCDHVHWTYGDCSLRVSCPILLNFLFVLMPGRNLRDLVAAICNVVFGSRSYFVVFVCQFIWCFMCFAAFLVASFWSVRAVFVYKINTCGPLGHFYFGYLPLCLSCAFSDKGRISPEFEPVAH